MEVRGVAGGQSLVRLVQDGQGSTCAKYADYLMKDEIQQPWLSMDYNAYLARRMYGVPNPLFQIVY